MSVCRSLGLALSLLHLRQDNSRNQYLVVKLVILHHAELLIQIITMTSYTNLPLHSIWQSTEALYLTLTVKLFSPVLFVIGFFAGNS